MSDTDGARYPVSYLGLDKQELIRRASLALVGGFAPLFPIELIVDMDYIAADRAFSGDRSEYHRKLYARDESLYRGDNLTRNLSRGGLFTGRGAVTVTDNWIARFPQYRDYAGDTLALYPLCGGAQAVCVPRSVYPRLGGALKLSETALGVSEAARGFASYAVRRYVSGAKCDTQALISEYARENGLRLAVVTQKDVEAALSRVPAKAEDERVLSALRAAQPRQYAFGRYAADLYAWQPVDKRFAKLCQVSYRDSGFISDLWMPLGDALRYQDKKTGRIDAAALCRGWQIAPDYAPDTLGGRYPEQLRVVTVADRKLQLLVGDAINNPAYGGGMDLDGRLLQNIVLPKSRELLESGAIKEEAPLALTNREVGPKDYLAMNSQCLAQQRKGELIDQLYLREKALKRYAASGAQGDKDAMAQLTQALEQSGDAAPRGQLSLYDADAEYLRRKARARENMDFFRVDEKRERSIALGYETRQAALVKPTLKAPPKPPNKKKADKNEAARPKLTQMSLFELGLAPNEKEN